MAKIKLGTTLAGESWLLDMAFLFDADSRFARGKTYFNKGFIKKLSFDESIVSARVKGTYGHYEVNFAFNLDKEVKERIVEYFHKNPLQQSALLNGQLSEPFLSWAKAEGINLFLNISRETNGRRHKREANYRANCNCYDYYDHTSPCKHIMALWFALCTEIDNNPLLLLKLHGVELSSIVASSEISDDVPYPVEIIYEKDFQPLHEAPLTIIHQENALAFIMSLMPSNPPFAPFDYKEIMREFYKANQSALAQILTPIHSEHIDKIERLFKEAKIEIVADKTLQQNRAILKHKVFRHEDAILEILAPYIEKSNKLGCSMSLLNFARLFLSFSSENGSDYYRYFYQLCRVAYLSINANSLIPSVVKEESKEYFYIAWSPLRTQNFNEQFEHILPNAVASVRHLQRGDYFDAQSGTLMFLSALLSDYVHAINFMHKRSIKKPPQISKSIFLGERFAQRGGGTQNIDKAVANTFSIFMLYKNRFKLNVALDLDNEENNYKLSLHVEDTQTKTSAIFREMYKQDSSKELLKLIAPIRTILPEIEELFESEALLLKKEVFEDFILQRASLLGSLGVQITLPKELHSLIKPRVALSIKSKKTPNSFLDLQKILEYDWVIAIGDESVTLEEFLALVKEQGELIRYKENFITLSAQELKDILANANKKVSLNSMDILREKLSANAFLDSSLESFIENLFLPKKITIPATLNANLRAYQERGITWMLSNLLNNFGVILADDMGLGKTVQSIAVLLYLYENKHAKKSSLVVVPTSLLNNWQNELVKFAPSLDFSIYYGSSRKLLDSRIIITTYDTLKRDDELKQQSFDVLIIDEAQKIKNPDTQAAIAIKEIKTKYRIALSGTPVENSLTELWSIFDFTLKGYLGNLKYFTERFVKPIEIEKCQSAAATLKRVTAPFMLRRLKTDSSIISDLPDKIVIDEYISMTTKQAALYQGIVDETILRLQTLEPKERFGLVFKLITELKQVCNHPRNYDKKSDFEADLSGKALMLLELLETIVSKGEKVLIFTQYVEMLNILCEIIEKEMLIEPLRLDGSMSKNARNSVVEIFEKSKEHPIFILSLKAGGVGLNLTEASNVIHYDLWFNPAVENQATDRAFRIGQNKNVFVYRFITKNSFEEKIDNMIKAKLAIGEMSISVGEKSISSMSNDEIKELFS